MKFLHLSDTHLRRDYASDWFTHRIFNQTDNPSLRFRQILQSIDPTDYDFALVTGDLVHEGQAEDYHLFREIMDQELRGLPYFVCRGNHDQPQPFFDGMDFKANETLTYAARHEINGLQIISLDTAQEDSHEGRISQDQMDLLAGWLDQAGDQGSILLMHHPLIWEEEEVCSQVPQGFEDLIAKHKIHGIFVGHVHTASTVSYHGTTQYMSEAISFGVDEYPDESIFVNRTGYNTVTLEGDQVFYYRHYVTPQQTMIARMSKPFDNSIF